MDVDEILDVDAVRGRLLTSGMKSSEKSLSNDAGAECAVIACFGAVAALSSDIRNFLRYIVSKYWK